MGNTATRKTGNIYCSEGRSSAGDLPDPPYMAAAVFFLLASLLPVIPGCRPSPCVNEPLCEDPVGVVAASDTIISMFSVSDAGWPDSGIGVLDVFLFSDSGTRPLEKHRRTVPGDTLQIVSSPGDKILVLIANSPYAFNLAAVPNLDAIEQIRVGFPDDDPRLPLMSAALSFEAGAESKAELQPLMCRIVIESVSNLMSGYRRLEDPQAFLSGMNPEAELLRYAGFAPSLPQSDTLKIPLPCDIGLFTQYPGTELFCYPNDPGESSMSSPSTVLNLEGSIGGAQRLLSFPLPPLRRGCTVRADISFDESSSSVSFR